MTNKKENNKSFWITTSIIMLIMITVAWLLIWFYWCVNFEISIWEIINSLFWAFITIWIFYAGNQLSNKKDNKAHLLEEIWMVEWALKDFQDTVINEFEKQKNKSKIIIILQAKIKYIANKIKYICQETENKDLDESWNNFREEMTDRFGYRSFSIDDNYVNLFLKHYNELLTKVTECKKKIINS